MLYAGNVEAQVNLKTHAIVVLATRQAVISLKVIGRHPIRISERQNKVVVMEKCKE